MVYSGDYFFLAAELTALTVALTVALLAVAMLASAISAACLTTFFMLSKAELAASRADLTALLLSIVR